MMILWDIEDTEDNCDIKLFTKIPKAEKAFPWLLLRS